MHEDEAKIKISRNDLWSIDRLFFWNMIIKRLSRLKIIHQDIEIIKFLLKNIYHDPEHKRELRVDKKELLESSD